MSRLKSGLIVAFVAGAIPAAAITFGTNYMTSQWGWRLPMIFQGEFYSG